MRVMLMIKGDPQPGAAPSDELLGAMGSYNDEPRRHRGAVRGVKAADRRLLDPPGAVDG